MVAQPSAQGGFPPVRECIIDELADLFMIAHVRVMGAGDNMTAHSSTGRAPAQSLDAGTLHCTTVATHAFRCLQTRCNYCRSLSDF